jgi:hypothetical protein
MEQQDANIKIQEIIQLAFKNSLRILSIVAMHKMGEMCIT